MSKEFSFFIYLIESYAEYKGISAAQALQMLDDSKQTDFVFSMYEMYHSEAIENAFTDIDSLTATGKPAW